MIGLIGTMLVIKSFRNNVLAAAKNLFFLFALLYTSDSISSFSLSGNRRSNKTAPFDTDMVVILLADIDHWWRGGGLSLLKKLHVVLIPTP